MSKASFSLKKILVLVTILAVPGLLYYLLTEKGKNRYRPLSIYGPKQVSSTFHVKRGKQIPDTLYHTIPDFKLKNQEGKTITFKADSGIITVVNFFFTRCPSFCPNMNKELYRVVKIYEKNPLIRFLTISVDPEYDTPQILSKYSSQYSVKHNKWNFLTGDKKEIYTLAQKYFLVDALVDTTQKNNVIHSPKLIMVDPKKRIRGYYDSDDTQQVDKLIDEIKLQITEELRKVK